jgi:hypothetical protein
MSDFVFKTWDASGVQTFGTNDRLGRILGKIDITGANNNGSFTDAGMLNGEPFALFFSDGTGSTAVVCLATASGQTVTWTFGGLNANQGFNPSGFILYGIR